MDPGANSLNMFQVVFLPRAGLDCAWGIARTAGQMMLMPWNVLASMAGGMARMAASGASGASGATAPVLFAGLVSPGLYLVRIVVPSGLSPGPQIIQVSAGSSMTAPSLVLMVGAAG